MQKDQSHSAIPNYDALSANVILDRTGCCSNDKKLAARKAAWQRRRCSATAWRTAPLSLCVAPAPAGAAAAPNELARVDGLLMTWHSSAARAVLAPDVGRPSTPVECYLRLMFLKFRHQLGFESLCTEVSDSSSWRRFCPDHAGWHGAASDDADEADHRYGEVAVARLNETLWAKACTAPKCRGGV